MMIYTGIFKDIFLTCYVISTVAGVHELVPATEFIRSIDDAVYT